jgi:hypothetical protein
MVCHRHLRHVFEVCYPSSATFLSCNLDARSPIRGQKIPQAQQVGEEMGTGSYATFTV